MNKHKKHFTLMELLMVIAIIAILFSLLFPSFRKAKGVAKDTACLANINEAGKYLQLRSMDHKGFLPKAYNNWPKQMIAEGYFTKPVYCESWTDRSDSWGANKGFYRSYGLHLVNGNDWYNPKNIRKIKDTASYFLLTDTIAPVDPGQPQFYMMDAYHYVHLRHGNFRKTNMSFLDGSAKMKGQEFLSTVDNGWMTNRYKKTRTP